MYIGTLFITGNVLSHGKRAKLPWLGAESRPQVCGVSASPCWLGLFVGLTDELWLVCLSRRLDHWLLSNSWARPKEIVLPGSAPFDPNALWQIGLHFEVLKRWFSSPKAVGAVAWSDPILGSNFRSSSHV